MSVAVPDWLRLGAVPLDPRNFTSLARTPWAGERIGRLFKALVAPEAVGSRIGEAWEFSCDPDFPSKLAVPAGGAGMPATLLELVRAYPEAVLSRQLIERSAQARAGRGAASEPAACEILIKLLNAAEPLSLQVHPADGDAALAPHECGKPESWLVLEAEPGAGIYLGFAKKTTVGELEAALAGDVAVGDLLHFVRVRPGDYFEIGPGVPHAIGAGVTLLEPQRVLPGRSGKTYRMYDWGRRYDAEGRPDPSGKPRPLHLRESLALIDPERQVGAAFAASLRRDPIRFNPVEGTEVSAFPANPYYRVYALDMARGAQLSIDIKGGYGALVMLDGTLHAGATKLVRGQPALLPASAMPMTITAESASRWALVVPARCDVSF